MKGVPIHRLILFLAILVLGFSLDLLTKHWIFARLGYPPNGRVEWIWPGYVGWELSLNEGALFGLGQGMVPVFVVLSVVAAVAIVVWLFRAGGAHDLWLTVALAAVMAGIFGNLWDRLGLHGLRWWAGAAGHSAGDRVHAVRDWILLAYKDFRWPNFNVADSLLVCGVVLILLSGMFGASQEKATPSTEGSGRDSI